ncbi:hypothetical protein H4217_007351 [Coemansia sp. RSA 1939]|nr:hypothetical protein H4217_007351 [Coemansia sp. RSA 1939]KAJ2604180.1 hypothetical protein EV177_006490 [Coemansia sp. RSA 1804]
MLRAAGNAANASAFDPRADAVALDRPSPSSVRAARQRYIEAKYVARAFVDRAWRPAGESGPLCASLAAVAETVGGPAGAVPALPHIWDAAAATRLLFAAAECGDAGAAVRAIALGADVNGLLPVHGSAGVAEGSCATPLLVALFGQSQLALILTDDSNKNSSSSNTNSSSSSTASNDAAAAAAAAEESSPHRAHLEIAELLLLNGASAAWQDAVRGFSALHVACAADKTAVAKYLLDKGADPLLVATQCGRRPIDLIDDSQAALKPIVESATLRAEERIRLEMASRSSADHPTAYHRHRRESVDSNSSAATNITTNTTNGAAKQSGASSVFAAARRFTQSLNPSAAVAAAMGSRMSVSTERPSMMELSADAARQNRRNNHHHHRQNHRHQLQNQNHSRNQIPSQVPNQLPHQIQHERPVLGNPPATRPPMRLMPAGFRDLGGRFAGAPSLPPILSAREPPATPPVHGAQLSQSNSPASANSAKDGGTPRTSRSATMSMTRRSPKQLSPEPQPSPSRRRRSTRSSLAMDLAPARSYAPALAGVGSVSAVSTPTTARFGDPKSPLLYSASTTDSFVDLDGCVSVGPSHPLANAAANHRHRASGRWILRSSSSADVLKPSHASSSENPRAAAETSRNAADLPPPDAAALPGRSRFRLLPRAPRLPFNGFFGRSGSSDKKHSRD